MDLGNFDAEKEKPLSDFELVPLGWYKLIICGSDEKDNSKNTGSYLQIDFKIVGGEHDGAAQTDRFNLSNPSEKTVEIAKRQLGSLCMAAGKPRPGTSNALHDLVVMAKIVVDSYQGKDGEKRFSNKIKKYEKKDFVAPKMATQAVTATESQPSSGGNSMPWNR